MPDINYDHSVSLQQSLHSQDDAVPLQKAQIRSSRTLITQFCHLHDLLCSDLD